MSILGSLIVRLDANTASFVEGLTGASKTARTVGREIESSFSTLGSVATAALAPFGATGAAVGAMLGQIGSNAGTAIQALGKMSGGTGALAVGLGAAAGALAAVTTGSIALAVHTALSNAELGELSQKTGVSTRTLASLGIAAKETGVPMESLGKALEFMNSNAVKAAIAPQGAKTAFSRLGVEVTDASGKMRETSAIFTDVMSKIAALPQPEQGYFTKAIFGRGGAEILPMLNLTKERMEEIAKLAKDLDLGNPQTVAQSQKFKEIVTDIQTEFEGMALRLTKDLLPAINAIAVKIEEGFRTGSIQAFIDKVAELVNKVILASYAIAHAGDISDKFGAVLHEAAGGAQVAYLQGNNLAIKGQIGGMSEADKKEYEANVAEIARINRETASDVNHSWNGISWKQYTQDVKNFKQSMEGKPKDAFSWAEPLLASLKKPVSHADLTPAAKDDKSLDSINKIVDALRHQAEGELLLARAAGDSVASLHILEAENKANETIGKLNVIADGKQGEEKKKLKAVIDSLIPSIRALSVEQVVGKELVGINTELDKQTKSYEKQRDALQAMGEAQGRGGGAVLAAIIEGQLEGAKQKAAEAREAFLRYASATEGTGAAMAGFARSAAGANAEIDKQRSILTANELQKYTNEIEKQSTNFSGQRPLLQQLNQAYLQNEESIRRANVSLEVYNWTQSHPGATPGQIADVSRQYEEQSRSAKESALAQSAGQYTLSRLYDEQINKLKQVKEVLQSTNQDTLLIDARLFDAQQQLIHQWDDAAAKIGTFGQQAHGILNEIVLEGQNAGKKIQAAFLSAYDSITGGLAKLATGQKADFKQIVQSLAEQVTKAEIQKGIGALTSSLGFGKIPGLSAKADGSDNNPFYVVIKGGGQGGGGDVGGLGASLFQDGFFSGMKPGAISSFFGGPSSAPTTVSSLPDQLDFGGFMAGGGDLTPGKSYIAGEKGPEIVRGPGTVTPMNKLGGGHQTSITNNYPVFKDHDMFRRSGPQIMAYQHRQMSIAYARR